MENPSFAFQGGIKLPIGYRFYPTDEELVNHYLLRKVFSLPLPASVIPEFDVFKVEPWRFPGDCNEKRHFFSKRTSNNNALQNINMFNKAVGCSGFWKYVGKDKPIVAYRSNQIVGMRRTLIFREQDRSFHSKNRWVMHELRLVLPKPLQSQTLKMDMRDWVVYRIFQKRKANKKRGLKAKVSESSRVQRLEKIEPRSFIDFKVEQGCEMGPPEPSSPSI